MFGSRHEKHAGHTTTRQHLCTVVILAGIGLVSAAFGAGRVLPPLDPPLKHWLYQLPETDQMDLASVTVQVQDELGAPVPKAAVLAHCRPWHYICSVKADNNGRATLRGPLGDWTVYASGSG